MSEVALKRAGCVARSQEVLEVMFLCLYNYTYAAVFATVNGFVDDALRNTISRLHEPLLIFNSSMSRFGFRVQYLM